MRKFLLSIFSVLIAGCCFVNAADWDTTEKTLEIGQATGGSGWHPINTNATSSGVERIYKKKDFGNPETDLKINEIDLHISSVTGTSATITVYVGNTDKDPDPLTMKEFTPKEELTQVYYSWVKPTSTTISLPFNEPFVYDHTKNLCVVISIDGCPGWTMCGVAQTGLDVAQLQYYSSTANKTSFDVPTTGSSIADGATLGVYTIRQKTNNLWTTFKYNEQLPSTDPEFSVSSESVDFGDVYVGEPSTKTITFSAKNLTGDVIFSSDNAAVTLSSSAVAANTVDGYPLSITVNPANTIDNSASIAVSSASGDFESKTVSVSWNPVVGVPELSVDQTSIDFGTVNTASPVTKTLVVTGLHLTGDVTIEASEYDVFLSTDTIAASDANGYNLGITIRPYDLNTTEADVTLKAEGCEDVTVHLTWNAVMEEIVNTVGSKTDDNYGYYPLRTSYTLNKFETVYSSSVLGSTTGKLKSITYYHNGNGTSDTKHFKVWVENTSSSAPGSSFTDVSNLTKVFEGDITINPSAAGVAGVKRAPSATELVIEFEKPFQLDGSNLRLVVEATSDSGSNVSWDVDGSKSQQKFLVACADDGDISTVAPTTYSSAGWYAGDPVVTFTYAKAVPLAVETVEVAEEAANAQIFDLQGRCVKSNVESEELNSVLSSLNRGIYVVKAGKSVKKMLVK